MSALTTRFQNIYNLGDNLFEIIGVGAIGSFTAMNLVRAGAENFCLWDDDIIAPVNIGVQHYTSKHIGLSKTKSLRNQMLEINPNAIISAFRKRFDANLRPGLFP